MYPITDINFDTLKKKGRKSPTRDPLDLELRRNIGSDWEWVCPNVYENDHIGQLLGNYRVIQIGDNPARWLIQRKKGKEY